MATRKIALNTEPNIIEIGDAYAFKFEPEVFGDVYVERYSHLLADTQKLMPDVDKLGKLNDGDQDDPEKMRSILDRLGDIDERLDQTKKVREITREFIASFMLPESATEFLGVKNEATGGEYEGGVELPDRVLKEMMQAIAELYGARPTGSSNGSAPASQKAGNRSTRRSQSKGQKSTTGR